MTDPIRSPAKNWQGMRPFLLAGTVAAAIFAGVPTIADAAPSMFTSTDVAGKVADAQSVEFNVFLPLRNADKLDALLEAQQNLSSGQYHEWLTPAQFSERFGPSDATVAAVTAELTALDMVVRRDVRSLHVTGSAAAISRAFGSELSLVRRVHGGTRIVMLTGLHMTPELIRAGAQIFNFIPRKTEMQTYSRVVARNLPDNRTSAVGGYYYNDLKQAYAYPAVNTITSSGARLDGTGTTIGVLMSSDIKDADVTKEFTNEGYATTTGLANPKLFARVYVDGASGTGGDAFDEASLDVQMELGGAPGAHVMLYDIPDLSDTSIMDGYTRIVNDNLVSVMSSSFGGCELAYQASYNNGVDMSSILAAYHTLFQQGNSQGISFLASSGDSSGKQCPSLAYFQGKAGVFQAGASSPATDPAVTGVGGTNLVTTYTSGSLNSAYSTENAYSDPEKAYDPDGTGKTVSGGSWGAGGGASYYWATPSYQTNNGTSFNGASMRTTPDIGMQVGGCPGSIAVTPCNGGNTAINGSGNTQRSYVEVVLSGSFAGLIGTSVASPEFASAVALAVEVYGRQGNINYAMYSVRGGTGYHTSIPGYNGIQANTTPSSIYDYTVGLGTPVLNGLVYFGNNIVNAGVPHTASNP